MSDLSHDYEVDLNAFKDGKFKFDPFAYPMFIKDQHTSAKPIPMQQAIEEYKHLLHDTHQHGFKETFAVLPSGATPGELCLMIARGAEHSLPLREDHSVSGQIRDPDSPFHDTSSTGDSKKDTQYDYVLHCVARNFLQRMSINVCESEQTKMLLQKYLTRSLLFSVDVEKKLMGVLKRFLKESGLKTKGYTSQLKLVVMDTLHNIRETGSNDNSNNNDKNDVDNDVYDADCVMDDD